ncbi:ADP-glyceromanno-heptose 6-epimerase, partial [Desulfovibrio sp. OttesenSCG-928-C14]|nr:ADP-glyceromanno-heptose 6-epimerase [Desulfovibrio sp. OttesenSCG-928-C14]
GAAGMIGSALLWELNRRGVSDVLVVDNLASSEKWKNLVGLDYLSYMHRDEFFQCLLADRLEEFMELEFAPGHAPGRVKGIVHLGACSSTTEKNAEYLMSNNLEYSKVLCDYALTHGIRYIQASSAATYGDGALGFDDDLERLHTLKPLNMYGYSKHLFDLWALRTGRIGHIASIKFFNVYGPNEYHKGEMRSMVQKSVEQIRATGRVRLFKSYKPEYSDGGQLRDFIYVKDCARILADLLDRPSVNGLFNLGTGQARSWLDLAGAVFKAMERAADIEFIEMPEVLQGKYQYYTKAEMKRLNKAMGGLAFMPLEEGVADYVRNYLLKDDIYL